ncbi:class I SAM-dependent methyltransferase [Nisaea sediminum]|uniref:class I SAM-dependent methyltransferase n=1 Tax=Nisaea sediminum TaxID=2775867 RepID=UPI001866E2C2|nr:class I SAM-dependent methyltransferase [Nisaea sediminum]
MTRADFVSCLPKGGVGIEIGVAEGEFASVLLDRTKPSELHLVDPWLHQDRADYIADRNNVDDAKNESRFAGVTRKFGTEIEAGRVHVHRGFSGDILPSFADHTFDWAYVDAMHTRDAVLEDLRLVWPKIKPDGFVLGHDLTNGPQARAMGFGVVEGVRDFIKESGCVFVAMTMTAEVFPSYILTKTPHEKVQDFLVRFFANATSIVEIRSELDNYQSKVVRVGKDIVTFPSF